MQENLIPISDLLPEYKTVGGALVRSYNGLNGYTSLSIQKTNVNEYRAFCAALEAQGAILHAENEIVGNLFMTYLVKPEDGTALSVHAVFYPAVCNARITVSPHGFLPDPDPAPLSKGNGTRTAISQPLRDGVYNGNQGETVNGAPGMGYVVTLADGSFLVIDGGPRCAKVKTKHFENGVWTDDPERAADDVQRFYDFLKAHTAPGEKPVIAAWLFTHPHSDHVNLAIDFLERYKDDVTVRIGGYNFPDFTQYPTTHENNEYLTSLVNTTAERLSATGAETWTFKAGERMYFPGCELEILFTPEDYLHRTFAWGNHTSSAFRLKFAKKTVMILGDCEKDICQSLADKFGTELKSDILQVSHHGVNGACPALYRLIDPDVCFWPIDGFRFETDERCLGSKNGYEFNAWLRDETVRPRIHYPCNEDITLYTD